MSNELMKCTWGVGGRNEVRNPGRGAIFICPLCPLYKSFATAGLDPSIHLQKYGRRAGMGCHGAIATAVRPGATLPPPPAPPSAPPPAPRAPNDSNVKEMLPLVSMEDMLVVKTGSDDIVPAIGTKTSAAWFSSGTYAGDGCAVKQFETLRGQVLTPDHPVVDAPVCLSVCSCVVQCLVAVVSLFRYIRQCVCVCVRACMHASV
jgi:hypothetical protein